MFIEVPIALIFFCFTLEGNVINLVLLYFLFIKQSIVLKQML